MRPSLSAIDSAAVEREARLIAVLGIAAAQLGLTLVDGVVWVDVYDPRHYPMLQNTAHADVYTVGDPRQVLAAVLRYRPPGLGLTVVVHRATWRHKALAWARAMWWTLVQRKRTR